MATVIRPSISKKNKYWIDKHRHYELKHFCLQYKTWKKIYAELLDPKIPMVAMDKIPSSGTPSDPTAKRAMLKTHYSERIKLVEQAAMEADKYLHDYILKAVTEGRSYTYLKTMLDIPCSKDTYYERYRRFFWILNELRD